MQIDPIAEAQISRLTKSTAYKKIQIKVRIIFVFTLIALMIAGFVWPYSFGLILVGLAFLNYFVLLSFRLSNIEKPKPSLLDVPDEEIDTLSLSVILPLKNEGLVIKETIEAIQRQIYPASQVEILIIVEKSDDYTQNILQGIALPFNARIVLIPSMNPFTKGRALLYGLNEAKNEIITVFDAESRPEPGQFAKALTILEADPNQYCIQAKVRISNKDFNWITRNFAVEYFEWFEQFLQELSNKNLNFGLGGNSFYVSKSNLLKCGAWDPFNVTEDAELSVRLIQSGVKLKLMDSFTYESCPDTIGNWLLQRVRWDKGLLITQMVHLVPSFNKNGFNYRQWTGFWLRMVAGTLLPFFNLYVFLYFIFAWFTPRVALYADLAMWTLMTVSIAFMLILNIVSFRRLRLNLNPISLFGGVCGYISLHILAGFIAFNEYFAQPLKWNNTRH